MVLYSAEDRMATLSVSLTYTPRLAILCKRSSRSLVAFSVRVSTTLVSQQVRQLNLQLPIG
jgi:hypothetical protein